MVKIWFLTPTGKVLLKKKKIGERQFFVPFSAFKRVKESTLGTINRIAKEIEPYGPAGKYKIQFHLIFSTIKKTKKGKITELNYLCLLPFSPIIFGDDIIEVGKDEIKKNSSFFFKEDYQIILTILGVQTQLEFK